MFSLKNLARKGFKTEHNARSGMYGAPIFYLWTLLFMHPND